jgi:hypothetical protein
MSEQIPIMAEVSFDRAGRKKDRSVTLSFNTNYEVSTADFMEMDKHIQETGWLLFSPNEIQASQVPDVPADEAFGSMTPSQETRWLLRKLWEAGPQDIDWPDYYRNRMAAINRALRDKLDEVQR